MEYISGDDLLNAGEVPVDSVHLPQLKKDVCCQGLTALGRSRWERSLVRRDGSKVDPRKMLHARGMLIALCVVNNPTERKLVYRPEQAEQLSNMPAIIMEPIYDLCRKLSGIGDKDVEELEQLSAEEDGSDSVLNSASTSAG